MTVQFRMLVDVGIAQELADVDTAVKTTMCPRHKVFEHLVSVYFARFKNAVVCFQIQSSLIRKAWETVMLFRAWVESGSGLG